MNQASIAKIWSVPEARSMNRNLGLDLLRAIAILLVVFGHGLSIVPPFADRMLFFWWTSYFGVELFFVLSGYLIGSILFELCLKCQTSDSFRRQVPGFWIRRWFRTLPNYYLFLIVNAALYPAAQGDLTRYALFLQNFFWRCGSLMSESWSLAIEEWFYLTFPIVLIAFMKLIRRPRLAFGLATVSYIAAFVLFRSLASMQQGYNWDEDLRKVVVFRLDSIAYGTLMMLAMRTWPDAVKRARHFLLFAGTGGIVLTALALKYGIGPGLPSLVMANLFTLTSAGFACWLPFAVWQTENAGVSVFRNVVAAISIISYSMYLLHASVALKIVKVLHDTCGLNAWYAQYFVYITLSFVLSVLVYNLYERRMTGLRNRFATKTAAEL